MQSMLSTNGVARRYGISIGTVLRYRKLGLLPAPLMLGSQTMRWRAADLDAHDDWILRRIELKEKGLDPDQAREPRYTLPLSIDPHQLAREHEAARYEPVQEEGESPLEFARRAVAALQPIKDRYDRHVAQLYSRE